MKNDNEKISPKYVFLHLFAIVMLYIMAINVLTLIFQYINLSVKDLLSARNAFNEYYSYNLIRFALASMIIVSPLFIWSSWFLNKLYLQKPEIRKMKTRKWLIYLTVFIVAIVIVADLITIVWSFLSGEITLRFFLKAISVFIVAGFIFGYYLWDVRRETPSKNSKYFAIAVIVIILTLLVLGFTKIGSPFQERLKRFDYQKVSDLQGIQSQIIFYWQGKERLPQKLEDLEDPISGYKVPKNPQTKESYEYSVKSDNEFELCTNFNLEGQEQFPSTEIPSVVSDSKNVSNWKHEAGKYCFDRKVDKDLYPPFKKD